MLDQHRPAVFGVSFDTQMLIATAAHWPHAHRLQVQVLLIVLDRERLVETVAGAAYGVRIADSESGVRVDFLLPNPI